ncbi:PEP-CTERM sorting domain-containing protein [Geobacter anodireducens]|uniref:Exosortase n=1 Tax=Geobacter soli TaxID=1510391 RepID=A0A0C1QV13_9BACT|nr:PEP-CTERM sorting domain-containing protein [Geobacter soli]ANA40119.1 PEP-CTERM sorting domain-containing protein [Geobacter anodireducens]KIE42011.1 exosortase [Geobacter soli]
MRYPDKLFLAVLMTLLSAVPSAWSYPMQYTLEGYVIQGPGIDDSAGFLSDMGITVGSRVSYTIVIDLDARGTVMMSNGTVTERTDPYGRGTFYAHYAGGSTITSDNYLSSYNGISENNYGGNKWLTNTFSERWLSVSSGNNYLSFYDMLLQPDALGEWSASSARAFGAGTMRNTIFDEFGNSSKFYFSAQITNAETVPVPEPSTFAFLGAGLAGIILLRRKKYF